MGVRHSSGAVSGLIFLVTLFFFVASLVAAGGAYVYTQAQVSALAQKKTDLEKTKGAFDPNAIQELTRVDARINSATLVLQKHIAASAVFGFLSEQTLQNVSFDKFTFAMNDDGSATISLSGQADSFSTIALQSDQFSKSRSIHDAVFSGINVGSSGNIIFTVKADVSSDVINFLKALATTPASPEGAVSTSTEPTSSVTQ